MQSVPATVIILLTAAALGIVNGLTPHPYWQWATAVAIVCAGVAVWPLARGQTKKLAIAFLLISSVAIIWAPINAVAAGAAQVTEIIAVLLAAQILNDAIIYGGYDRPVKSLLARLQWPPATVALIGGYLLSWGFSLTSMPVVYSSLHGSPPANGQRGASPHHSPVNIHTAVLLARAFAAAAITAPIQPTVLLAIAITGTPLLSLVGLSLPLTWLVLLVAVLDKRRYATEDAPSQSVAAARDMGPATNTSRPLEYLLLAGLFAFLGLATFAISMLQVRVVAAMAAGIILAALLWGPLGRRLLLNNAPVPAGFFQETLTGYVTRMADGVLLIGAGGIAGFTLTHTPLMGIVGAVLQSVHFPALAALLTLVVVVGLRLVGVAPAVVLVTFGPLLMDTLPLSNVALATLLTAGSGLAFVVSPFSVTSAMAAALTGLSPLEMSLPRQMFFTVISGIVVLGYVTIVM